MRAAARTSQFWKLVVWATLLGAFAGVFTLCYLWIESEGRNALWPELPPTGWFTGEWWWVLIPTAAGIIVGVLYQVLRLPSRFPGFVEELEAGHVEWRHAPGAVGVALVSLIGGASLGPEAPLGTATGAAGSWLAERRGGDAAEVGTATFAGMSGAFGGLLSSPLVGTLFGLELEHGHDREYFFRHLIPGIVAGLVGFTIVFPVLGPVFLGLYEFPEFEAHSWHMAAGVAMGVLGAAAAIVIGLIGRVAVRAFIRLDAKPIVRGAIGGLIVGFIAFMLPLTLFSGVHSLEVVIDEYAAIGVGMLIAIVLAKAVALGVSMGCGFYGGQFFPIFFMGGTLGAVVHIVVPDVPLALAVGSMLASVGAALAPIPLSVIFIAVLLLGVAVPSSAVVGAAAITAFIITYGFGLVGARQQEGPA